MLTEIRILVLAILVLFVQVLECQAGPSERLLNALVKVESSGRATVVGDGGKAVGCLQIHTAVIDDVNRRYGTKYRYSDRTSIIRSKEICRKYLVMHGGHHASDEVYARIWNGGPMGHKKKTTIGYWKRVKARLG